MVSAKSPNSKGNRSASASRKIEVPPVCANARPYYKIRIAEMGVPVEVVVNRVVDAAVVFAAEADIHGGDAIVLQKSGVVGSGAKRTDALISALAQLLALLRRFGFGNFVQVIALPGGKLGFRIADLARDIVAEFFQRVRTFDAQIASCRWNRS